MLKKVLQKTVTEVKYAFSKICKNTKKHKISLKNMFFVPVLPQNVIFTHFYFFIIVSILKQKNTFSVKKYTNLHNAL